MTSSKLSPPADLYWTMFKWSVMAAGIFWTFVYRLSQQGAELSGFVYANF